MKINLGYVAISETLNITSSSTMTYKTYKSLKTQAFNRLNEIILSNFRDLKEILKYNIKNDIVFYRMTSALIPLATHNSVDYEIFNKYTNEFIEIGNIIKENNLRVDIHPDQFCVLNSINEEVVNNTINILTFYKNMLKAMDLNTYMILHIGSKTNGKKEGLNRFKRNYNKLDDDIKKLIIIENDDKVYNIRNTLKLCEELKIPMVLDYHHHLCNKNNEKIEDYIDRIFKTWGSITPKIHFSSPKNKKEFRSHSDYIDCDEFLNFIKKLEFTNKDFDIMLECKRKDEALFRLIRQIKYKTNYKFIKNTFFIK